MLIKVKEPDLYQKWLNYYEKYCTHMKPYEQRTFAFINSNKRIYPPL